MLPWKIVAIIAIWFSEVRGHGYLIDPPNRASLWRVLPDQPSNFDDNQYFCGGVWAHYHENDGLCGPCGDNWSDPVPRSNENGGTFGNGIVIANYTAGSVISVTSVITANHLGHLYFHLCQLSNPALPEDETCFQVLYLEDGTKGFPIGPTQFGNTVSRIKLPDDVVCERCVLRWHYRTANSWGLCDDGTQNIGCGNQEVFRSCADIRIDSKVPNPDDDNNDEEEDDDDVDDDDFDKNHDGEEHDLPDHDNNDDELVLPCKLFAVKSKKNQDEFILRKSPK